MNSVNKETTGAIKLTRADAVKLVVQELQEITRGELAEAETALEAARTDFRDWAVNKAHYSAWDEVEGAMLAVGSQNLPLNGLCNYQVFENGADPGTVADVVFTDRVGAYESRMRLTVTITIEGEGLELRTAWQNALTARSSARYRDLRANALSVEARKVLIDSVLDSSEEGRNVLTAVRAMAAAVKGKV